MNSDENHQQIDLLYFLLSPSGAALAAWIQTFAVIFGLYFAIGQLREMSAQTQSPRNQKYDELLKDYKIDVGDSISEIRTIGAWARQKNWSDQALTKAITDLEVKYANNTRVLIEKQIKHLQELSTCSENKVCPAEKVRDFLCRDAGRTYSALDAQPSPSLWIKEEVWRTKTSLEYYIAENCGLSKRIEYFGLFNR